MRRIATLLVVAVFANVVAAGTARADAALDALIAAYPDHLAGHDGRDVIFKDGTRLPITDGRKKSFEQMLEAGDIRDQFAIPYRLGPVDKPPGVNEDPGRIRNEALFRKLYGDCRKGEVAPRLVRVPWLTSRGGGTVMVTRVNGVAGKVAAVAAELDRLPAAMTKYLVPSAGAYNCRVIAGTKRLSVHAFGAAIDISAKFGDYWRWGSKRGAPPVWRNRVPQPIVDVFERYGFIWGGKWYHYDTLHFEYRPELIALAKRGWPGK